MAFTLRKDHLKVHADIEKTKQYEYIARQLDFEFPERFATQVNNEALKWIETADAKASKFDIEDDEDLLLKFCRIVIRIGLDFDSNTKYQEINGILSEDPEYSPEMIDKHEQLDVINDYLEFNEG